MPQGNNFWNPYRFVPVRENIEHKAPFTDERFQGNSGYITCTLQNLSLLFIGGGRQGTGAFIRRNSQPVLPGSSLKGMLRSLAEIVGGGCFVTDRDNHCQDNENLCISCRMFGMLERGKVHKGQVSVSDGILQTEDRCNWTQVSILQGQPKKSHSSFYKHPLTGAWARDMMKFYFHQPQNTENVFNIPHNLQNAQAVANKQMLKPGHEFEFKVFFENLSDAELDLLLYVLALEDSVQVTLEPEKQDPIILQGPLRHKLGNAKGQGPGSCKIDITELVLLVPAKERFQSLKAQHKKAWQGQKLQDTLKERTYKYCQGQDESATMHYLRKMMVWDVNDQRGFSYPDYNWFRNDANQQVELKNI